MTLLQRGAARVSRQVYRTVRIHCIAALALPQEPAANHPLTGRLVDAHDHTRAAIAPPDAKLHLLYNKSQARIRRRAFCLAQQMCSCAFPRTRHGSQNLAQLLLGVLGEYFISFGKIRAQRIIKCLARALDGLGELIRIKARHVDRIGLHEPQIHQRGGVCANLIRQSRKTRIIHTDV